jgi:OmpR family response regulator RpaB
MVTVTTPDQSFRILVVEDDPSTLNVLEKRLAMQGFAVTTATNGIEALERFRSADPDAVVLDVMMPELDGFAVLERIRAVSGVPVILLTALGELSDRVTGLELGADDYMVKPFSPKELEARIRCLLRRLSRQGDSLNRVASQYSNVVSVGDLQFDFTRRQAHRGEERIRLTGMEFNLLELLVSRNGEPVGRSELLETIWGYTPERANDRRVVDVHVSRLRAKLEDDPENPELILTARGMGYLFQRLGQPQPALAMA